MIQKLSNLAFLARIHTHAHTHTHTHTHTYTHTYTHNKLFSFDDSKTQQSCYPSTHTHTYTHIHTYIINCTILMTQKLSSLALLAHTLTHTHTHTHTPTHIHTHSHNKVYYGDSKTQQSCYPSARTHTHTHTHTYTPHLCTNSGAHGRPAGQPRL